MQNNEDKKEAWIEAALSILVFLVSFMAMTVFIWAVTQIIIYA